GVSANVAEALAAGSAESVGPCQYRRAWVTVPETPLSVIELLPEPPRIPPTPAETTSVLGTMIWFPSWLAIAGLVGRTNTAAMTRALRVEATPSRLGVWNGPIDRAWFICWSLLARAPSLTRVLSRCQGPSGLVGHRPKGVEGPPGLSCRPRKSKRRARRRRRGRRPDGA